jgi:hypothetical protein
MLSSSVARRGVSFTALPLCCRVVGAAVNLDPADCLHNRCFSTATGL